MKLAIIGSRDLGNIDIDAEVDALQPSVIVSGGATGVDSLAEDYAQRHNLPLIIFKPEYGKYPDRTAPLKRNDLIVAEADFLLAFWNGKSRGTLYTIQKAQKLGKPVKIIRIAGDRVEKVTQHTLF
ncbi:MAG: DUF2493 domain-containing protein [Paludibacteraceae bacterium]|nr:DUF2493 domain-containing protein [Paludibacteraceae bacterium]